MTKVVDVKFKRLPIRAMHVEYAGLSAKERALIAGKVATFTGGVVDSFEHSLNVVQSDGHRMYVLHDSWIIELDNQEFETISAGAFDYNFEVIGQNR